MVDGDVTGRGQGESVNHPLTHPLTGEPFASPVPPGTGWPGDPGTPATRVATTPVQVRRLATGAAKANELTELDALISVCRACPRLVAWREEVAATKRASFADQPYWGRPVPGFGAEHPSILVVGLAPAANGANRTGRNFTGDSSGDWLYASLHRSGLASQPTSTHAGDGLTLSDTRIVATVRCAPPHNKPTTTERDTCAPWLNAELDLLRPSVTVMVALGSIGWGAALRAVANAGGGVPKPKPKFGHLARAHLEWPDGKPLTLIGSYHPSQHNTFTGRLTEEMLDEVFEAAKLVAAG